MRIAESADHKKNAFDFLRLAAALAVLFSHSYALYGYAEPKPVGDYTLGSIAVFVFFVISGFLVCQSWERDPNAKRFMIRRALRIMPGLFFAVLFTAFIIGPLATTMPLPAYFTSVAPWAYLLSNASTIAGYSYLPGVFEGAPSKSVNGSLWTLRYEVLMYLILVFLGTLSGRGSLRKVCFIVLAGFFGCWMWIISQVHNDYDVSLPLLWRIGLRFDLLHLFNLASFFFAGVCIYLFRSKIKLSYGAALMLCVALFLTTDKLIVAVLALTVIPYTVIVIAYRASKILRSLGKRSDLSYGIYIYAFPVQQLVSGFALRNHLGWLLCLIISTLITLICAALSWHYVEAPALSFKTRIIPARA